MNWRTNPLVASVAVVAMLSVSGVRTNAIASVQAQLPSTEKRITMTMNEWKMKTPKVVPAGKVTIVVSNRGKVEHELVLLRTDLKPSKIRIDKKTDKFDEEAPGFSSPGEIEGIKPGKTKSTKFDLAPGHYIFVCNLVGHFRKGMYAEVMVK
jgi:uncharacterized cupredoxin-like copper-binding protein